MLCMAVVFVLALGPDTPELFSWQDKFNHVAAFFCLGFLFSLGASPWGLVWCAAALTGAAFSVEFLQDAVTSNREGSLGDVAASVAGLSAGMGASLAIAALTRVLHAPATSVNATGASR